MGRRRADYFGGHFFLGGVHAAAPHIESENWRDRPFSCVPCQGLDRCAGGRRDWPRRITRGRTSQPNPPRDRGPGPLWPRLFCGSCSARSPRSSRHSGNVLPDACPVLSRISRGGSERRNVFHPTINEGRQVFVAPASRRRFWVVSKSEKIAGETPAPQNTLITRPCGSSILNI